MSNLGGSRMRTVLVLALLTAHPALARTALAPASLGVGGRTLTFDEIEGMLASPSLRVRAAEPGSKDTMFSMTLHLVFENGGVAKFRIAADPSKLRRNVSMQLEAAAYVVSRLVLPEGGIIAPCVLRSFPLEELAPMLPEYEASRLRKWADGGRVWGSVSFIGEGNTRAEKSPWFGGHSSPEPTAKGADLPARFLRDIGNLNLLAIVTNNGDVHGDNWEIRHEDGACFLVDSGITFGFHELIPTHRRWSDPCAPMAAALPASTVDRLRCLLAQPIVLDSALETIQGTPFGLPPDQRWEMVERLRRALDCIDGLKPVVMSSAELMSRVRRGDIAPYRFGKSEGQRLVLVKDW